jgi:hypothetical protein
LPNLESNVFRVPLKMSISKITLLRLLILTLFVARAATAAGQSPEKGAQATPSARASAGPSAQEDNQPGPSNPSIDRLNQYRKLAHSPAAVPAALKYEKAATAHARYLIKNYASEIKSNTDSLGAKEHSEDRKNPGYSLEGMTVAPADRIEYSVGANTPGWAIDRWMVDPFQRFTLLDPGTRNVSYGEYCENGVCAGALGAITSFADMFSRRSRDITIDKVASSAIEFPPNQASTELRELPDLPTGQYTLAPCEGYKAPTGLPITLQFPRSIKTDLSAYSVTRNGRTVAACGYGATSYKSSDAKAQKATEGLLTFFGAVVIIPRQPLEPGRYAVSAKVNGRRFAWSFAVK